MAKITHITHNLCGNMFIWFAPDVNCNDDIRMVDMFVYVKENTSSTPIERTCEYHQYKKVATCGKIVADSIHADVFKVGADIIPCEKLCGYESALVRSSDQFKRCIVLDTIYYCDECFNRIA